MVPRMQEKYRKEIIPEMMKIFSLKNKMAVPYIDKIVINMGVGEALTDVKILDKAMEELATISGQRPLMPRWQRAKLKRTGSSGSMPISS